MADLVEKVGNYISKQVLTRPDYARKLLVGAFEAYGWKLRHLPNPKLSHSKQYLSAISSKFMTRPLFHPDQQILTSIFTPCEIFHAMNLYPMCAEQFAAYTNGAHSEHVFIKAAEDAGIAETFCSYHKVVIGAALSGVLPKPEAIVNTSLTCDANNLTFRKVAEIFDVPRYYIDVPWHTDEEAIRYVADQLREMARFVEDITGRSLQDELLRERISCSDRTIRHLRSCIPLRKNHFVPSEMTAELYEILMAHNALGTDEALRYAGMLHKELSNAPDVPGRKILWMHPNPFYQSSVKALFNYRTDPRISLSEMCCDGLIPSRRDDPYEIMAERCVLNTFNGPASRRAEAACALAKESGADGVILFCHWGCKETCGASTLIADTLEEAGFPVLVVNGDGVDRLNAPDGQIITRISAFMEMLER